MRRIQTGPRHRPERSDRGAPLPAELHEHPLLRLPGHGDLQLRLRPRIPCHAGSEPGHPLDRLSLQRCPQPRHSFSREREEECILGLLLAPIPRGVLFLGKFLANLLFLMATEVPILPIFAVFFNVSLPGGFGRLLLVILLVDIGFVAVGTLFSAMTAASRAGPSCCPSCSSRWWSRCLSPA